MPDSENPVPEDIVVVPIDFTDSIGESAETKAKRAVAEITQRILDQQAPPKEEK